MVIEWTEGCVIEIDLVGRCFRQTRHSALAPRPRCLWRTGRPMRRAGLRAFSLLEMMVVIAIIGLLTALALPHMKGFTQSSSMTGATRQFLDDINFARQRALANRSEVCMVFLPPGFWTNMTPPPSGSYLSTNAQMASLYFHQLAAYALIAMRTVGDQPGQSNVHYLTDWKPLPQGVFISPFQFTNSQFVTNYVWTTNTTPPGLTTPFPVTGFLTSTFPFPSTYSGYSLPMPYIGFTANGQLTTPSQDQYLMLASGSILYQASAAGPTTPGWIYPDAEETPPANDFNYPNILHIDWLTARTRIEHNQF